MKSLKSIFSVFVLLFVTSTVFAQSTQVQLTQSVVMYPERYAVSMRMDGKSPIARRLEKPNSPTAK